MSIRVDLIVGRRGEDKKEASKEEVIEEEEVTDDASEADSGVDPGQDDQVNLSEFSRILDKKIMRRGRSQSVATATSPLNSTTVWTGGKSPHHLLSKPTLLLVIAVISKMPKMF